MILDLLNVEKRNVCGNVMDVPEVLFEYLTDISGYTSPLAVGEHDSLIFAEYKSKTAISMVVFDKNKASLRGLRIDPVTRYTTKEDFGEDIRDREVACAALLTYLKEIYPKAVSHENEFKSFMQHNTTITSGSSEEYELQTLLGEFVSLISKEIHTQYSPAVAFSKNVMVIDLSQVEIGKLMPSKIHFGKFEGFMSSSPVREKVKLKDIRNEFILDPDREFTEEEQSLMFDIPDFYSPSANVVSIAKKIKKSWEGDKNLRKTNVLMEGPKGTGKTMDAKVLSRLLGLPYTKETCFSDMDSSNVIGSFLPVADEETQIWIPSEDEIFFDPAGCYEKLTGEVLSEEQKLTITETEVQEAIQNALEKEEEKDTTPKYVFYSSEIVKAFENGWLCELQEPTCIADAAVLMILNSALEKDGVINLPHRIVKRHPDCIFVVTTNRDYEGCRPLNQALRDRFNITKKVSLPSDEELIDRLKASTDCQDMELLRKTVEAINALNDYLANNGINDSVSLRGMQDFVADVMRGFDLRESALEDMIYKITTDDDEVAEIEAFLETSTQLFN